MNKPEGCPWCGAETGSLFIAAVWAAVAIGEFSLAGQVMKLPMYQAPVLVCRACRKEIVGLFEEGGCRFDPDTEPNELTPEQLAAREASLLREARKERPCATDDEDDGGDSGTASATGSTT